MKSEKYIKAKEGPNHITIYYTSDNSLMIKSGGSWAWRNNNPGNLRKGIYSAKNGRIGFSGGFAVFPSVELGDIALRDLLKNGHQHSSLQGMIRAYAPPKDKNKTAKYLKFLLSKLGIKNPKTMVRDLSQDQFENLVKAIKQFEGWEIGKVNLPLRITKIMKDEKKKTIVAYYVTKLGWVLKDQAIVLAEEYKIDAVISTSPRGNLYLRTRPDIEITNNLDLLG
jgi:hypothetical protein